MLPLDLTTSHELPFSEYKKWIDPAFADTSSPSKPEAKSLLTHFTSSILEQTAEVLKTILYLYDLSDGNSQVMRGFGVDAVQLHDPITVWCAICNPPVQDDMTKGRPLRNGWGGQKRLFQVER